MRISDWSSDVCSSDLALIADFCAPSLLCLWKRTFAPGQKGGKTMKWGQVSRVNSRTALMAGIAATMMWAAPAAAQERQSYTIPSGDAAQTVQRLAVQSGVQVMVPDARSEEHTSELQSLMRISYAVFCLKKKTIL